MKTLPNRRLLLAVSIILVLLTAASSLTTNANLVSDPEVSPEEFCKCGDLPALINRRREVAAAVNAIDAQISKLDADEKSANKVFGYTDADYTRYFSEPIEQAVSATHDRNSQQVMELGNFTIDCLPSVAGQLSDCLREALTRNYRSRKEFCKSKISSQTLAGTAPNDWRSRYPLETMADEARKGYLAERAYLTEQIDRLMSTCKFGKWSGEVTVSYIKETEIKPEPKPDGPPGPHQNRRTEETTINESENVVLTLVDGIAVAEGTADYSKHYQLQVGPELWCRASTRPDRAWVPFSHTEIDTYQVSGSVFRGANVSIGLNQDGTYTISAGLPSGIGSGTSSKDISETGECAEKFPKQSNSATYTVGGYHAKGKGTAKQNALVLDGNDNPKPDVQPANTTTTITMQWHLERSRPQ